MAEYPHWRNYFDVSSSPRPSRPSSRSGGRSWSATARSSSPAAFPLERGKIYEGGNLHDLERALGAAGDEILYVGDHIYGDILRSKKESAWRTAMIIQELEGEVQGPRLVPRGLRPSRAPGRRARPARGRAALLPGAVQGALAPDRPARRRSSANGARCGRGEAEADRSAHQARDRPRARHGSATSRPSFRQSSAASTSGSTRSGGPCSRRRTNSRASGRRSRSTRASTPRE